MNPFTISRRQALGGAAALALSSIAGSSEGASLERFGDSPAVTDLLKALRALPEVSSPNWIPLHTEWHYAKGSPLEGLEAIASQIPAHSVTVILPHSVLEPDTPLWYAATIDLPGPCALSVDADDGAHLFVDGTRVKFDRGIFPVESSHVTSLIVRVLNKAVFGGLASVRSVGLAEYRRFDEAKTRRSRLEAAIQKLRHVKHPRADLIALAKSAIADPTRLEDLERALDHFAVLTIPPTIHVVEGRHVIAWETDLPIWQNLEFGTADRMISAKVTSKESFHIAELHGLAASQDVLYRLKHGQGEIKEGVFRTLPDRGPFSFTVWGDSHIGFKRFAQTVSALRQFEDAAFTVGVGDLVVDASYKRPWEEFFALAEPLFGSIPCFFMGGNHDYDDCFDTGLRCDHFDRYARVGGNPYHAWTVANARFVALDPNIHYPTGVPEGSAQHQWFMNELNSPEWKAAKWRFVFIHHPPYGCGWTCYQGDIPIRALLDPLVEPHGIDFIVSGHIHDYERLTKTYGKQDCTFLVVGGAGGALEDGMPMAEPKMDKHIVRHHVGSFEVHENSVAFQCFGTDMLLLDHFTVNKSR